MSLSIAREAEPIAVLDSSLAGPMLGTDTLTVVGATSAAVAGAAGGIADLWAAGLPGAAVTAAFPGADADELVAGTLASTDCAFCSPVTWVLARRISGLLGYSLISHRYRRSAVPRSSARPKRR